MEILQGKISRSMTAPELAQRMAGCTSVLLDLGTGDGQFVLRAARESARAGSGLFVIGVDACRENLREASCQAPTNALFVIANAQDLPAELYGLAGQVTINFPWGSLRDGLLQGEPALLAGLRAVMRAGARLEVRLNASALAEAGWELLPGGHQVAGTLAMGGFAPRPARLLDAAALRALPTTWSKRLAFSRKPEAVYIQAK